MMPIRFKPIPTFAICGMVTHPDPNTIALGGVATGSIKAQDADIVAGTIKRKGLIPIASAVAARIGIKIVEVAVFDVTSVRKVSIKQVIMIITIKGT